VSLQVVRCRTRRRTAFSRTHLPLMMSMAGDRLDLMNNGSTPRCFRLSAKRIRPHARTRARMARSIARGSQKCDASRRQRPGQVRGDPLLRRLTRRSRRLEWNSSDHLSPLALPQNAEVMSLPQPGGGIDHADCGYVHSRRLARCPR